MKLEDILEKYKDSIYINLFKILNLSSSSLLDPCYNPPIASLFKANIDTYLFRDILANDDFDMVKYIRVNYIQKVQPYKLLQDHVVWFLLLTSIYFTNKKKKDNIDNDISFMSGFLLLLKYYTSLSVKHMSKFCDKAKAILAIETLSEKSLFSGKNQKVIQLAYAFINVYSLNSKIKNSIKNSNIALGMAYLFNRVLTLYFSKLSFDKPKIIAKVIIILRSRLSQSFKAYARHYYDLMRSKTDNKSEDMDTIEHNINQVVNSNAQRLVFISDNHFDLVTKMTEVPIEVLKRMYESIYRNNENYDTISNIISVMFADGRFAYLQNTETTYEWLNMIRTLISVRTKYNIRSWIIQIIMSDEELKNIYESKSDSFKHKMIQGMGGVIALSIYDSIRLRGLSSFTNYAMII